MRQENPAPESAPQPAAGQWQRLHPLSPLLRGGAGLLGLAAFWISRQVDRLLGSNDETIPFTGHLLAALALVFFVLLVIVAGSWLSWLFSRFRIGDESIELRTGLIFRQHRQLRFDRVQSVDITQPILARLFGLAKVVVQSAGGADSHVTLSFLTSARADQVSQEVNRLSRADEDRTATPDPHYPTAAGGTAPSGARAEVRLLQVPDARILLASFVHPAGIFLALALSATVVAFATGHPQWLAVIGPVAFGIGTSHVKRLLTDGNFAVTRAPGALRVTHGFTELASNSVPLGRIQALHVHQPLTWRPFGWWRASLTVAGVVGEDAEKSGTLLPVGSWDEVVGLIRAIWPVSEDDVAVLAAGATGWGKAGGFTHSCRRARLFAPIGWRRDGYAATQALLVTRAGWMRRSVSAVPHARLQSAQLSQGPLARWRDLAAVRVDITKGPVSIQVPRLCLDHAHRLIAEQLTRSARARSEGSEVFDPPVGMLSTTVEACHGTVAG